MVKAAGIYARISRDTEGKALGVQRQEALCRELAERKGWPVAQVYSDNSISATNGDARPAYERMMTDIKCGTIDAVLCVDLDRLTRRVKELETFIELADEHGTALANVSGDTDLSTTDGRMNARIRGVVAAQESERKADRIRRQKAQLAEAGGWSGGPRPYGYEPTRDDAGRSTLDIVDVEASIIREAAQRALADESIRSICADLNEREVTTTRGNQWRSSTLQRVLISPTIAGLSVHQGEVVGDALWKGIIDRETHERLVAKVSPSKRAGRPATHLLSGIATCGRCGGPLYHAPRYNRAGSRYRCYSGPSRKPDACGRLSVTAEPVEDIVRDRLIDALAGEALAEARRQVASDDQAEQEAAAELSAVEDLRDELVRDRADGVLSRREWLVAKERLDKRQERAESVLRRNGSARTLADLPSDSEALRASWKRSDVEWKRDLVKAVVEAVVVHPAESAGGPFDPDRVEIIWR